MTESVFSLTSVFRWKSFSFFNSLLVHLSQSRFEVTSLHRFLLTINSLMLVKFFIATSTSRHQNVENFCFSFIANRKHFFYYLSRGVYYGYFIAKNLLFIYLFIYFHTHEVFLLYVSGDVFPSHKLVTTIYCIVLSLLHATKGV